MTCKFDAIRPLLSMTKPVPTPCRDPSRPANEITTTDGRTLAVTSLTLSAAGSSAAAQATKKAIATNANNRQDMTTHLRLQLRFCFGLFGFRLWRRLFRLNAQ